MVKATYCIILNYLKRGFVAPLIKIKQSSSKKHFMQR